MAFFPIVPLSKNDLLEMNYNWNKFCSWKTEAEGPNLFQQEDELVSDGGHGFEGGDAGGALADVWLFHHICIMSGAEPVMVKNYVRNLLGDTIGLDAAMDNVAEMDNCSNNILNGCTHQLGLNASEERAWKEFSTWWGASKKYLSCTAKNKDVVRYVKFWFKKTNVRAISAYLNHLESAFSTLRFSKEESLSLRPELLAMQAVTLHIPECVGADTGLIAELTPSSKYWKFMSNEKSTRKKFWSQPQVWTKLSQVFRGLQSFIAFSELLGVTPEMTIANMMTTTTENDTQSTSEELVEEEEVLEDPHLNFKHFTKKLGSERQFWEQEEVKIIIDDYESKDITADEAGPQLGLDADKFANKWKRFKAAERDRKRKTMTAMEQQVDWEEEKLENDEEMGEYEMMRLRNLKEKLKIFQQLQIQSTKAKVAAVTPVKKNWTKTLPPPRREPSARIQGNKEKRKSMNDDSDTFIESVKLSACAVPPVPLLLPEVLSIGIKQEVGKQTLNGIQAALKMSAGTVKFKPETTAVKKIVKSATPARIISSATARGLMAFGDEYGFMALINGSEEGLPWTQFRPHSGAVSSLQWVPGSHGILSSAGSDGYVRIWDLTADSLNLGYSWFQHHGTNAPRAIVSHTWLTPDHLVLSKEMGGIQFLDKRMKSASATAELRDMFSSSLQRISDSVVMSVGVDSVTYIDTRRLDNPLVQPLGKFIRSAELNSSKKLLTTDNRREVCVYNGGLWVPGDKTIPQPCHSFSSSTRGINEQAPAVWVPGCEDLLMVESMSLSAREVEPQSLGVVYSLENETKVYLTLKVAEDGFTWVNSLRSNLSCGMSTVPSLGEGCGIGGIGNGYGSGSVCVFTSAQLE